MSKRNNPYEIYLRPPRGLNAGDPEVEHELVFTRGNDSTVIALTTDELRVLFAATYIRLKATVPGSAEWETEHSS